MGLLKPKAPLVMMADDEVPILELERALLEPLGCETFLVNDSRRLVAEAVAKKPQLILLDIQMPVKTGLELLQLLKLYAETKSIPVLMVTAEQKGQDIDAAFKLGAAGYVIKPFDAERLQAKVKAILAAQGYAL